MINRLLKASYPGFVCMLLMALLIGSSPAYAQNAKGRTVTKEEKRAAREKQKQAKKAVAKKQRAAEKDLEQRRKVADKKARQAARQKKQSQPATASEKAVKEKKARKQKKTAKASKKSDEQPSQEKVTAKEKKQETADALTKARALIAKKKFGKANRLLKKYNKTNPKDLNGLWLQAQASMYVNNNGQSANLYQTAIKAAPENDYLKLDYIHSLADMGKTTEAERMLDKMENDGADYSDITVQRARINYYNGNYRQANEYIKKALQRDGQDAKAHELSDMVAMAKAPRLSFSSSYLSDNQPLKALMAGLKFEKTFSKYATLGVTAQNLHFMQSRTSDAPWIKITNKMSFPKAGLRLNYGAGVIRFPVQNETTWTGEFSLNQRISHSFDLDLGIDRSPYFGTKASIDTNMSATRFNANLNFHKNNWLAQAAFINSRYPDGNNVYSAYSWFLAPVVVFPKGTLQMGLSGSYSNAGSNRFAPANTLSQVLDNYTPGAFIAGVYDPYFTPIDQYIGAALLSFHVQASGRLDIYINGDVGYGSIYNPYFYLDNDMAGNVFINQGYSTEHFTPHSGSLALNYHAGKTWLLTGKYTYRSTYFFNSNYVTVGIEKSFLPHKKDKTKGDKKSAFARRIQELEERLAALYKTKDGQQLKDGVAGILKDIKAMRDDLQQKMNMSEITPGSEKQASLQEKIYGLTEMMDDINGIDLGDEGNAPDKRKWLVGRQYELANVHYEGSLDDE